MRVAVLGAAGTIAPAIVRDLAESAEVESILLLDLRAELAEQVAEEHGVGKASASKVDARSGLADQLAGVEVLVNSASYRVNLDAMRACLAAGCRRYLDLGGLYHVTAEQLALHDAFEEAGSLAILGIGSSPGKTNLMARWAVDTLGGRADTVRVMAAGRDLDPPDGPSFPYALETLLDELTLAPIVLRHGEPVEVEPLSDGGDVDFGEPIGVAPTIHTLHSELRTFGDSFGCGDSSFRLSLAPALLERLRGLVGAPDEAVREAAGEAERPSSQTLSVHLVEARDGERRATVRAVARPHANWGLGGGIVSTAAPAAAAVRLLARGQIDARGALPPERCIEPTTMFTELAERGCQFEINVGEAVTA